MVRLRHSPIYFGGGRMPGIVKSGHRLNHYVNDGEWVTFTYQLGDGEDYLARVELKVRTEHWAEMGCPEEIWAEIKEHV